MIGRTHCPCFVVQNGSASAPNFRERTRPVDHLGDFWNRGGRSDALGELNPPSCLRIASSNLSSMSVDRESSNALESSREIISLDHSRVWNKWIRTDALGELSPLSRPLITSAGPRSSRIQDQIIVAVVSDLCGFSWNQFMHNIRIDWNWRPSALDSC